MAKKQTPTHSVKSYVRVTKSKIVVVKPHTAYNPNRKPKSNKF
jgi:hypothetical protein